MAPRSGAVRRNGPSAHHVGLRRVRTKSSGKVQVACLPTSAIAESVSIESGSCRLASPPCLAVGERRSQGLHCLLQLSDACLRLLQLPAQKAVSAERIRTAHLAGELCRT